MIGNYEQVSRIVPVGLVSFSIFVDFQEPRLSTIGVAIAVPRDDSRSRFGRLLTFH